MKCKRIVLAFLFVAVTSYLFSQGRGPGTQLTGRFYGKIVDANTGKPVEFCPVQLFQEKKDSLTFEIKLVLAGGQLTQSNGDFSIDNIPVMGTFILKLSAIGYEKTELKISFDKASGFEKDLGNIKLKPNTEELSEVIIDGSQPSYRLEIDKKVFTVGKNAVTEGGTGEDVLKNVPSLNIDIDGNVTMRNAAPQIFVDGRPTALTPEQIPADAIESVEVISNPSAKYDAEGGGGGIVNIVLKKNKKIGYNGSIRMGVDSRGRVNGGGDVNARENKVNVFLSGSFNQRRNIGTTETERYNLTGSPQTNIFQTGGTVTNGYFLFARGGIDYFIDNRNTITLSETFHRGSFNSTEDINIETDTVYDAYINSTLSERLSKNQRNFYNATTSILYKHLFPKTGRELTGDISYSTSKNNNNGNFETRYYDSHNSPLINLNLTKQEGRGGNDIATSQFDYVSPLGEKSKIETGVKTILRKYSSVNNNFLYDYSLENYQKLDAASLNYDFNERQYAAYFTYSGTLKKLGYQAGLRMESFNYKGTIADKAEGFSYSYPVSLFPSVFGTYKINESNDMQLNYTRRINRPGFMQIIPFTDYADSLNISRGNASLKPEFIHSLEYSYQKTFNKQNNFIASAYFKQTANLITLFQVNEYDSLTGRNTIISTYANANSGYAYGLEFISKNTYKWIDMTFNVNVFNSFINGNNIEENLSRELLTWFTKLNLTFKLPKEVDIQLTSDYRSKSIMPTSNGGRGGAQQWFGSPPSTIQGFIRPVYSVDLAVKKNFGKKKNLSVNLSVSDIFRTRQNASYSQSQYFIQETLRTRDQQVLRLNISYRFGKVDASIFKRKNTRSSIEGVDTGM